MSWAFAIQRTLSCILVFSENFQGASQSWIAKDRKEGMNEWYGRDNKARYIGIRGL